MQPKQWNYPSLKKIKRQSRTRSLATILLALGLLYLSCIACISAPARIARPIEGWRIDPDDATLYRITPVGEDYMEIVKNPDMKNFMCFEKSATKEIILRSEP